MDGLNWERWQELCTLVAQEKDPARFSLLMQELLDELRKKEERLYPAKGSAA